MKLGVSDVVQVMDVNSRTEQSGPVWSRRGFALSCLGAASLLAMPTPGRAGTMPRDRVFAIFRDDDEIGRHEVRFQAAADGLDVTTDIDIAVKLAFITAFHFKQHTTDRWTDGLLVHSRATIDDNGTKSSTELEARGTVLSVEGGVDHRTLRVPLGTMTDIAFWNLDIVRQRELLDMRTASLTDVAAQHQGTETIKVGGQLIQAERYTVNSRSGRNGDIWFDAEGNWVKGLLAARGEILGYELVV